MPNLSEGGPEINDRRKNANRPVAHMLDQVEYLSGMAEVYKGLRRFTQACKLIGVIQPLPYEGEERLLYESRFSLFERIQLPKYVPYETYKEQIDAENASPDAFN